MIYKLGVLLVKKTNNGGEEAKIMFFEPFFK
jgi:hypothetical protein